MKTNSKNGTNSLTTLSSDEICTIIEKCSGASVTSLKISKDGVEILFGNPKSSPIQQPHVPESVPQATLNQNTTEPGQSEVIERDPQEIEAEDELQELQIADPLEYESRLARGELIDGEQKENN